MMNWILRVGNPGAVATPRVMSGTGANKAAPATRSRRVKLGMGRMCSSSGRPRKYRQWHSKPSPDPSSISGENARFSALPKRSTLPRTHRGPLTMSLKAISLAATTLAAAVSIASPAGAQNRAEYIPLGRLSAALYHPDSGPAPHVAFILAHRTANYLNHIGCREL